MGCGRNRPGTNNDLGFTGKDWRSKERNVLGLVLIVCVSVDDHIRSNPQRFPDAVTESVCKTTVSTDSQDMVNPVILGDFHCAVGAAIINDHPLNSVEALYLSWQLPQRDRQAIFLIQARYLYDKCGHIGLTAEGRIFITDYADTLTSIEPLLGFADILARGLPYMCLQVKLFEFHCWGHLV